MTKAEMTEIVGAFATDPRLIGATWERMADHFPDPDIFTLIVKCRQAGSMALRAPHNFAVFWNYFESCSQNSVPIGERRPSRRPVHGFERERDN
jgi:hypothetical protein